jgi:hypothetical protein
MPNRLRGVREALQTIEKFTGDDLTSRIAKIERAILQCDGEACRAYGRSAGVTSDLLSAAYVLKQAAGQVNVLVHAVAVMLLVPQILKPGEKIESVSLGAGNTGRDFDVETNRRVAEFKFIHWKGRDTIRQNSLFKDFYLLAEYQTTKRKEFYVLETVRPLQFLRGRRAIRSVLSRNVKLLNGFQSQYGDRFATVGEYYAFRQDAVKLINAAPLLPELLKVAAAQEAAEVDAASL